MASRSEWLLPRQLQFDALTLKMSKAKPCSQNRLLRSGDTWVRSRLRERGVAACALRLRSCRPDRRGICQSAQEAELASRSGIAMNDPERLTGALGATSAPHSASAGRGVGRRQPRRRIVAGAQKRRRCGLGASWRGARHPDYRRRARPYVGCGATDLRVTPARWYGRQPTSRTLSTSSAEPSTTAVRACRLGGTRSSSGRTPSVARPPARSTSSAMGWAS